MDIELLNKSVELEKECERFLGAFNPDSLPRVVERGMKPILAGVAEILKGSVLAMVDVKQVPVGHDKCVEGIVHIGIDQQGKFIVIIASPDGLRVTVPRVCSFEELISLGVNGMELVQGVKTFISGFLAHQMSHTQGSA